MIHTKKKHPPKDSLTLLPCFYFVELPILASSMVSLYLLERTAVLQPAAVAFRCHDNRLSLPHTPPEDELIPSLMLLSLAFSGPAASIMLVEGCIYVLQSRLRIREGSISAGGCSFNSFLRRTVRFVGVHVFGLLATALLTDIIQLCTGYHAPFFLTVCKPNYTAASCDQTHAYVTHDICSGHDQHAIMAARKTFPSQHATLSAFAAVYVSMYFNATVSPSTKLLKPLLVFAVFLLAAMTGLTQITQHRAHPRDVYIGFIIGAFVAAYLAYHAVGNFGSGDDITRVAPPPTHTHTEDPLRALTERGHDSVYNKGPASASESNDDITAPPPLLGPAHCPPRTRSDSISSLKRCSVDAELLAPRSPVTAKETMLTFSNTLPRASINAHTHANANAHTHANTHANANTHTHTNTHANANSEANMAANDEDTEDQQLIQPVQPVQRRLKAVQVPMDPLRSQQLVSEWKQKSLEMRGTNESPHVYQTAAAAMHSGSRSRSNPTPPPPKAVATPRAPQMPPAPPKSPVPAAAQAPPLAAAQAPPPAAAQAPPPAVSPKSAMTRAKWLAIREKTTSSSSANQPRLMQVIAMSKQQGLLQQQNAPENMHQTQPQTCSDSPFINNNHNSDSSSPHYRSKSPAVTANPAQTLQGHPHPHPHPHPQTLQSTPQTLQGHPQNTPQSQPQSRSESPRFRSRHGSSRDSVSVSVSAAVSIVTVDAHASHHPVVRQATPPLPPLPSQSPPLPLTSDPWEWAGLNGKKNSHENNHAKKNNDSEEDARDVYDLNSLTRGDSAATGSSFRPQYQQQQPPLHHHHHHHHHQQQQHRSEVDFGPASFDSSSFDSAHNPHPSADAQRREMAMRRKTALVLLDRKQSESFYRSLQSPKYKD